MMYFIFEEDRDVMLAYSNSSQRVYELWERLYKADHPHPRVYKLEDGSEHAVWFAEDLAWTVNLQACEVHGIESLQFVNDFLEEQKRKRKEKIYAMLKSKGSSSTGR